VQRAGHDAGIQFAFDRIEVLPNTAAAHNLVAFAASRGSEAQRASLIDRLFTAYFMEGENIGDGQVLECLDASGVSSTRA
jgi:predicted DsbA family dithiol-disulfide isomerase